MDKDSESWQELPTDVQNEIDKSIAEADRDEGISHEEAVKAIKARYSKE